MQVTFLPVRSHEPCDGFVETKSSLFGSWSVTSTPFAVSGPTFVTVSVYVSCASTVTGSALSVLSTERSADAAKVPAGARASRTLATKVAPAVRIGAGGHELGAVLGASSPWTLVETHFPNAFLSLPLVP